MAIVRCPRCRDEVTVPPGATTRALVRCPLCLEEYLLLEALANAPPPLVIIGGEVPHAAIDTSPVAGHDYQLAAAAVTDSPENHWGHAAATTLAPRASTVRTGLRPRKRGPSIALLLLNWVGGGVLGLALAPLVLWWIFRVDPVELGPTVAAYAPWAVPQQFHGAAGNLRTDYEPVAEPPRRRSKKSTREKESAITEKTAAADELQSLPGLSAPAPPSEATSPAIEAPEMKPKATRSQTEVRKEELPPGGDKKEEQSAAEDLPPRPPMPDLTDLLP